ncbi:MAG: GGDEF domain-containing protein [Thermoanaerobaculia bacterium]|nr:GGDEF domain-containing protein [Thermoanaerobaculia bacterium]
MRVSSRSPVAQSAARVASALRAHSFWRESLVTVALVLLWLASWTLGRIQEFAPHASLWFPPAGLTFAAFAVLGVRAVPGIAAASILVTLGLGDVYGADYPVRALLLAGVLFAAAHIAAWGVGAAALRRWMGGTVPRAVTTVLLVVPASAALAALGGASALAFAGLIPWTEARAILFPWFVGDFVGAVALGPAFAAFLERLAGAAGVRTAGLLRAASRLGPSRPGWRSFAGRFLLCLLPLAGSLLLLAGVGRRDLASAFLVFFAILPLMWIVHTEGALRTFLSVAALSAAIAGAGAFVGPGEHTTAYQFAMIVLAGSAYFGLAVPSLYLDNENLRRLATTDALTGAANRGAFLEAAARETERSRRFGTPLSLVLLDLDRFKPVNDTFGHPFGDAVLAEVARRLQAALRESDVLGRIGGEEFAILLPMTDTAATAATASRLGSAVRGAPGTDGLHAVTVTARCGVAAIEPARGFDAARQRADQALYEAKRLGRDRVELAPPG